MLHHLRTTFHRLAELLGSRSRIASEQEEEFRFHLEMETAENVRRGMNEADARRAALLRFGGRQRFSEETRDARGFVALDNLGRDIRLALRRMRRAPGFAAGVIATLGVGIGVAVGIGAIVYGVLLRDLPYDRPEQLVRVGFHTSGAAGQNNLHSPATYFHFAKSARSFSELGSYATLDGFHITDGDAAERVAAATMTPGTFTLLGVRPLLGQLFETGDSSWSRGRDPILISQALWERRYGSDPGIIGRRITLNRGERTVIGVLPRTFAFPSASVNVWYPNPTPVSRPGITVRFVSVIGRMREGVDASTAEAELNALVPALSERFPQITPAMLRESGARVSVESLKSATVSPVRPQLRILGILVGIVLLIATTNVLNLFLLRTERAAQEIAIALSLGASRARLALRFVVEGVVLGLASLAIALPAAALAISTKFGFTEREIPRLHEITFGPATAALLVGCAALIGAIVGLTALSRVTVIGLFDRLRATHATPARSWRRAQDGLVTLQVAIALTLLVSASLLGRSFWNLHNADIGFDPRNAMTAQVSLPWGPTGYGTYSQAMTFHANVMDRVAALPGVTGVAVASHLPLGQRFDGDVTRGDEEGAPTTRAAGNAASAEYFRVMGIPLLEGRTFEPGDLRGIPAVVISARLARNLFGTTSAIGRSIRVPAPDGSRGWTFSVVGIAGDVPGERIEDGPAPMMYLPLLRDVEAKLADEGAVDEPRDVQYAIRGTRLPDAATIQRIVRELDPRVPASGVRSLQSIVDDATARVRLTLLLIGVAAAAGLILGVIGVYSVVSYAASGRAREFGIRIALGAAPRRVGGVVLSDGLRLVAVGAAVGLIVAVSATKFLRAFLFEVTPTSAVEFAFATSVLVLASMLAAMLPARRAARTDPAVVLRGD